MPSKTLQDSLYESLGEPFWKNHEEAPQILRWVRTVDAIHSWIKEPKEHYGHLMEQHNRETKNFHLPDNYIDERFVDICMCLDAMDPYLPSALEDGTHEERLKEVTRQITDELWSGDLDWLELVSELISEVLSSDDGRLIEFIRPVCKLTYPATVDQHRRCEPGNLVPGGWKKKSLWRRFLLEWFLWVLILIIVFIYFKGK